MFERFKKIPAIAIGTASIAPYVRRRGYHYLWFGSTDGADNTPLLWRLLSKQGGQGRCQTSTGDPFSGDPLLLLSEYLLGTSPLSGTVQRDAYVYFSRTPGPDHAPEDPATVWRNSEARQWCDHFSNACFSVKERGAVLSTWKSDKAYASKRNVYPSLLYPEAKDILCGDQVFFLSAEEAETETYGFPIKKSYTAEQEWWTRTYQSFHESGPYVEVLIVMTRCGGLLPSPATRNMKFFARPALNLNPDNVVFSSIGAAKAPTLPQQAASLAPVPKTANVKGLIWKLTLRDKDRDAFSARLVQQQDNVLTISYENAMAYHPETAPNERVSAVVTDADGKTLQYYGNIALPAASSGTVRLTLPKCFSGSRLFVFSEQCNDVRRTDFASRLIELPLLSHKKRLRGSFHAEKTGIFDSYNW